MKNLLEILRKKDTHFETAYDRLQTQKRRELLDLIASTKLTEVANSVALLEQIAALVKELLDQANVPSEQEDVAKFIEKFIKLENDEIEAAMKVASAAANPVAKAPAQVEAAVETAEEIPAGTVFPRRVKSSDMMLDELIASGKGNSINSIPAITPDLIRMRRATNPEVKEVQVPEVAIVPETPVSEHARPVGRPLHGTVEEPRFWNGPDKVPMPTLGKEFEEMK